MPKTNEDKEYVSYVVELMQVIGPVQARPMFGGFGVFLDKIMFALIADSILYLKVNPESKQVFEHRNLEAFRYFKKDKPYTMAYFQAPEEVFENSEDMALWANQAHAVALMAKSKS